LKIPLTSIIGEVELAQHQLTRTDNPDVRTAYVLSRLARVLKSSDIMLGLINELMDETRLRMDQGHALLRAPTDLVALVRDMIATLQGVSAAPITLQADVPELVVDVDAIHMARVMSNLLSNAIKYSPGGGDINVRVAREDSATGQYALISVTDQGLGIPAADLPYIFDRFARASNVVGQIEGKGIGLASAQGIVTEHGGTITVESQEGHGSTFTVRLPLM
jgi:signal transduction histidine kinase